MDVLAVEAIRVRSMISRLDAAGSDDLLRTVINGVDTIAGKLLERGAADPALKAEIIQWVLRFRAEKEQFRDRPQPAAKAVQVPAAAPTSKAAPTALQSPRAMKRQRLESRGKATRPSPVPHTEVFNYDTTDPRTKNPFFVKKPRQTAPAPALQHVKRPAPLGSTRSALLFTKKLEKLREDVRQAGRKPRSSADSILKARIAELYNARTTSLEAKHHEYVGDQLNSFALTLGTTIASFRAAPGSFGYVPVPQELTFTKGGPVVSGGLPTLGRGHR
jgi:hypothetical protein